MLLDQRGVFCRFERTRISDNAYRFDEWIPKCDGRSKTVKERQRCENGVVSLGIEKFAELGNISDNVAMTQDDAFRFARASARKKQGCFGVTAFFWNLQQPQ